MISFKRNEKTNENPKFSTKIISLGARYKDTWKQKRLQINYTNEGKNQSINLTEKKKINSDITSNISMLLLFTWEINGKLRLHHIYNMVRWLGWYFHKELIKKNLWTSDTWRTQDTENITLKAQQSCCVHFHLCTITLWKIHRRKHTPVHEYRNSVIIHRQFFFYCYPRNISKEDRKTQIVHLILM